MRVRINTMRYLASHGKEPRGRGLWLFTRRDGSVVAAINAAYGEAVTALKYEYRELASVPGVAQPIELFVAP